MITVIKAILGLGLVALAGCASPEDKLRPACAGADRVEVAVNAPADELDDVSVRACAVRETGALAALIETIDVDSESIPWCKCGGDLRIDFSAGERALVRLTVHHGEWLRWRDGNWKGQHALTSASREALDEWLNRHRCPTIATARQACNPGAR
jgi:hypothetical protein